MTAIRKILITIGILVVGIGCGVVLAGRLDRGRGGSAHEAPEPPPSVMDLQATLSEVARFVTPSIVHIVSEYDRAVESQGIGAGVVVSADGYVLTNHHVVQNARTIKITLSDSRTFHGGLVGADPESDLALVKLNGSPTNLQPAILGDSDQVRVGDFVLAVGSPFGLSNTLTFGIISAKGRKARLTTYEDYLQTDAAINPGNSGGALVSLRGQVIGINTAIAVDHPGGSARNAGVGFTIPINLAKWVMEHIARDGRVRRGFIGIGVLDFSDDLARRYGMDSTAQVVKELGVKEPVGCVIVNVQPGTPAERAGLVEGDIVVDFDGSKVKDSSDLLFKAARAQPGTTIAVKILRKGQEREFNVGVIERPVDAAKPKK